MTIDQDAIRALLKKAPPLSEAQRETVRQALRSKTNEDFARACFGMGGVKR